MKGYADTFLGAVLAESTHIAVKGFLVLDLNVTTLQV